MRTYVCSSVNTAHAGWWSIGGIKPGDSKDCIMGSDGGAMPIARHLSQLWSPAERSEPEGAGNLSAISSMST